MIKDIKLFTAGMCDTNSYVVSDEDKNCAVFDPEGSGTGMIDYIDKNDLKPIYVILTHGHFDHTGAVEAIVRKYGCKICVGEIENEILKDPFKNLSLMVGEGKTFDADILLKDGEELVVGNMTFKVMLTPGHTNGSLCFISGEYLISGDTLFADSCGRTDFPTGDWKEITKSLLNLAALDGDYKVLPGHGPTTTLSRERKFNQFMR